MTDEIKRAAEDGMLKVEAFSERLFEALKSGEIPLKYSFGGLDTFRRHIRDAFKSFRDSALLAERRKAYEEILKIIDNWDSEYEYEKWVPEEIANEIRRRMEGV